jgi:hypothetical protein
VPRKQSKEPPAERADYATQFQPGNDVGAATRFQPKQSGNPLGTTRERRLVTTELERLIDAKIVGPALAKMWLRKIAEGNWPFFKLYMDRCEGAADIVAAMRSELGSADNPIDVTPPVVDVPKRIVIPDVDERLNRDDV